MSVPRLASWGVSAAVLWLAGCVGVGGVATPERAPGGAVTGRFEERAYGSEGENVVLMLGPPILAPGRFHLEQAHLEDMRGRTRALLGLYTVNGRLVYLDGRWMREVAWDDATGLGGTREWEAREVVEATLNADGSRIVLTAFGRKVGLTRAQR